MATSKGDMKILIKGKRSLFDVKKEMDEKRTQAAEASVPALEELTEEMSDWSHSGGSNSDACSDVEVIPETPPKKAKSSGKGKNSSQTHREPVRKSPRKSPRKSASSKGKTTSKDEYVATSFLRANRKKWDVDCLYVGKIEHVLTVFC